MSQQPPPPPYGAPPSAPPPRGGLSNKAKFWIGVPLAIPALFLAGVIQALPSALLSALLGSGGSPAQAIGLVVVDLALLGLVVAAIVWERTRYFALGILAGTALLLVLLAGACVVLLTAYSSGG